jgi:hypothetical protein
MKVVYIAHPISGDIKGNLEKIRLIVRELNLTNPFIVPFAPYWLDCHALDDTNEYQRKRGMYNTGVLFKKGFIDEVWLYGDRISNGMAVEIELAGRYGIPVVSKSEGTEDHF